MTTTIAQNQDIAAARAPLPPVEKDIVLPEQQDGSAAMASGQALSISQSQSQSLAPATSKQPEQGNWFHRNRWFTKEPITYTGYQFFRSAMATIPYGFGMAFVHHLFGLASRVGVKMGLTETGQNKFYDTLKKIDPVSNMAGGPVAATKALDVYSATERASGTKGVIGRNLMRVANSPLNQAVQIGLAFSMFRFVGSLIKGQRDKVMDENNTPEDTNRETKNWWQNTKELMHVNWKAEATGTFWAALTLGYIGALVHQTTPYKRLANETTWNAIKRVVSKPSKLLQNGAIWAISYSTFFEVDERIQKDFKTREGNWKGQPNSLINKPDVLSGAPPIKEADGTLAPAEEQPEKPKHGFFTADPGLPRLWLRRVLPVAVGITGYAVMKRSAYVLGGGQMAPITNELKGIGNHLKHFGTNAWREGLATGTFGILWMATDAWGSWYDKFFQKLQNSPEHKPVTEHQHQKYSELLDRVNAKEQGAGRAA